MNIETLLVDGEQTVGTMFGALGAARRGAAQHQQQPGERVQCRTWT